MAGVAGSNNPNRGPLTSGNQPIATPTGLPYGQGTELAQAQAAVPMAAMALPAGPPPGAPVAGPPPGPGAPGAPPSAANNQQPAPAPSPLDAAQAMPFNPVGLSSPSARPTEPITNGLPTGPGAGPEAITRPGPSPADALAYLADATGDSGVAALAAMARARRL